MKRVLSILALSVLLSSSIYAITSTNFNVKNVSFLNEDVLITIDSQTSDDDIKDIISMLNEYGVIAKIKNIKRNTENLITGLNITLEDSETNSKTSSNLSSNTPITTISFGKKNGQLFITHNNDNNLSQMLSQLSMNQGALQSGLSNMFNNNFMFNMDSDSLSVNGQTLDLNDMMKSMDSIFSSEGIGNISSLMNQLGNSNFSNSNADDIFSFFNSDNSKKYKFTNDPNIEKLIVIDGEISDFDTLNNLAESDNLEHVDFLKPDTAKSIYGEKAKDGAIIAVSKK